MCGRTSCSKTPAESKRRRHVGIELQRDSASKAGLIGGRVTAQIHKKNGTGLYDPKVRAAGVGMGGRVSGKTVGRIQGRKNRELGRGWFAPGNAAKGGRSRKTEGKLPQRERGESWHRNLSLRPSAATYQ